ncbi:MAG: hypothetical protein JXA33_19440 [Anaerolineae bacterium]|nr:hypothetical protein [Anaerolineae bacterium]
MKIIESSPIFLQNDRLTVEVAQPGSVYAGTRFDWTTFITQVTLDGTHTYCVPESLEPGQGTGGSGLCNEFGIEEAIGYDDAQPGECFPKLGIGLLVKPEPPPVEGEGHSRGPRRAGYNFFLPHEIAARFPIHIDVTETQATFILDPVACRGYAARLTKTVSIDGAELTIAYVLENVGESPIKTTEYIHNFTGIDGHAMGPDYRLRLPYTIQFDSPSEPFAEQLAQMMAVLDIQDGDIRCKATPEHAFYCRPLGFTRTDAPQWELIHEPSGVGMREYDDFTPDRVAVWGTTHVISAEIFVPVSVQPGETQRWTRRYEFFA